MYAYAHMHACSERQVEGGGGGAIKFQACVGGMRGRQVCRQLGVVLQVGVGVGLGLKIMSNLWCYTN